MMTPDEHDFTGGHATMTDGTHVPLSKEEARAALKEIEHE